MHVANNKKKYRNFLLKELWHGIECFRSVSLDNAYVVVCVNAQTNIVNIQESEVESRSE